MSRLGLLENLEVLKLKDKTFMGRCWEAADVYTINNVIGNHKEKSKKEKKYLKGQVQRDIEHLSIETDHPQPLLQHLSTEPDHPGFHLSTEAEVHILGFHLSTEAGVPIPGFHLSTEAGLPPIPSFHLSTEADLPPIPGLMIHQ
ncbi:hypothetical protein BUALT_Bualt07G0132000 [Buddleja alternifolia]|uniref:Uncharacterized protein n=1 Tax=Buddleja alternifolia TaxID=168488 RepID=A0AAV6XIJ2_9LAMI|nr:hypothetical protein BUALT_Bualt07G0132000 [Buddleja alternifolia]